MKTWILTCPNCGSGNEILGNAVVIRCGIVYCKCTCINCNREFESQQAYWQWLGMLEAPPAELEA